MALIGHGYQRARFANLAGSRAQVSRADVIERSIEHLRRAEGDYGSRLDAALKAARQAKPR